MKKNKKPVYETPAIIPLGELARGSGMPPPGSGSSCGPGNIADNSCREGTGVKAKPQCKGGSQATNGCLSGVGVV